MKYIKSDNGKLRYDLVPVEIHESLAKVITYGANKYSDDNWIGIEVKRYEAALFRHINEWRKGNDIDKESGYHHLEHALSNLAFIICKTLYTNKYEKSNKEDNSTSDEDCELQVDREYLNFLKNNY